jgi:hypothetical protein
MRQIKKTIALWDFVIDLEGKVGGANPFTDFFFLTS